MKIENSIKEEFRRFQKKISNQEDINSIYQSSISALRRIIPNGNIFVYVLTKNNKFEKIQSLGDESEILPNEYSLEDFWLEKNYKSDLTNSTLVTLKLSQYNIDELIYYPLSNESRIFGIIGCFYIDRFISENKKELILRYAEFISLSVSLKKRNQKLEFILQTFREVKKLTEKKQIFKLIAERLTEPASKFSGCIIHLFDELQGNLYGFVSTGFEFKISTSSRIAVGTYTIGDVFKNGDTKIVSTSSEKFQYKGWARKNNYRSMVCIQLTNKEKKAFGTISLFTKYQYNEEFEDTKFLEFFADQSSIIIDGILKDNVISKHNAVDEILSKIIPITSTIDIILETFLDLSINVLNADLGFISLFDKDSGFIKADKIRISSQKNINPNINIPNDLNFKNSSSLANYVISKKKSYLYPSDPEIDKLCRPYENERNFSIESEILVPLLYFNEIIGVMVISSSIRHNFSISDLHFLEAIAFKTANVIQSKKFYSASQELNKFNIRIDTRKKLCDDGIELTTKVLDYTISSLWLLEKDDDSNSQNILKLYSFKGFKPTYEKMRRANKGVSWGVINDFINKKKKQPVFYSNNKNLQSKFRNKNLLSKHNITSLICMPLYNKNEVYGILNVYTSRIYNFFDEEKALLKNIGIRIGNALYNFEQNRKIRDLTDRWVFAKRGISALSFVHDITHYVHSLNSNVDLLDDLITKSVIKNSENNEALDLVNQSIVDNTDSLSKAFEYLLRLAYNKNEKSTWVNFTDCIETIRSLFRRRLDENNITIENSIDEDLRVFCKLSHIEQLLINLTINAIKAFEDVKHRKKVIRILAKNEESYTEEMIYIEFEDNACGISKQNLENIWERGFSTHDDGNGQGLNICKDIVDEYNGNISIRTELGFGTTFSIIFPSNNLKKKK